MSGILGIALGNRAGANTPPVRTAVPVRVGSVTFSDADPNDFSHPATTLVATLYSLDPPASGSTYVAWLCDTGRTPTCTSLGPLAVEQDGSAVLRTSRTSAWLLESGTQQDTKLTFEITAEPAAASTPSGSPSDQVVYAGQIPSAVLLHLRHELTHFPFSGYFKGNTTPLVTGLGQDAVLLQQLSTQIQLYQEAGDLSDMQEMAAYLQNLIMGKLAATDGDHDNDADGDIVHGDDGVGLGETAQVTHLKGGCDTELVNYLPSVIVHACNVAFASTSNPENERLFMAVQAAGNNIATWIATIEQIVQKVLAATQASDVTQGDASKLVNVADMVLDGEKGDVQNLDGVRQILTYIEQMATISVFTV
jgi:hypothetical protein